MNNIISLSGGKDSTAMLLMMLERKEPIHSVVFSDTGWEFPAMYAHLDLLEKRTGVKIWRLQPRLPFDYWMIYRPVIAREGKNKGKVHRIGNGWPSPLRRWCTRQKIDVIEYFCKPIENPVSCIGYADDEKNRGVPDSKTLKRFPLQELGMTEKDCLKYCYSKGYHWDGLYKIFNRVSCFCCPLKKLGALRKLRKFYPELWWKMLEMDKAIEVNRGFKGYKTVHDLEKRFAEEDRQRKIL